MKKAEFVKSYKNQIVARKAMNDLSNAHWAATQRAIKNHTSPDVAQRIFDEIKRDPDVLNKVVEVHSITNRIQKSVDERKENMKKPLEITEDFLAMEKA